MTGTEKIEYIFRSSRFDWIEKCLLGDIRTFLDGIDKYTQNKDVAHDGTRGGGNLSVPILICTGLELVSALYAGITECGDTKPKKYECPKCGFKIEDKVAECGDTKPKKYNATDNVKNFIERYFHDDYRKIPRLLWDGVRNGIVHTFQPKAFKHNGCSIRFVFYVEDNKIPSHIENNNGNIEMRINVFELFDELSSAVLCYKNDLQTDEDLQDKFIKAWKEIEGYERECKDNNGNMKEAEFILKKGNGNILI